MTSNGTPSASRWERTSGWSSAASAIGSGILGGLARRTPGQAQPGSLRESVGRDRDAQGGVDGGAQWQVPCADVRDLAPAEPLLELPDAARREAPQVVD